MLLAATIQNAGAGIVYRKNAGKQAATMQLEIKMREMLIAEAHAAQDAATGRGAALIAIVRAIFVTLERAASWVFVMMEN